MITCVIILLFVWMLPKLIREFKPKHAPQILKHKLSDQDSIIVVMQDKQCLWVGMYSSKDNSSQTNWFRSIYNN